MNIQRVFKLWQTRLEAAVSDPRGIYALWLSGILFFYTDSVKYIVITNFQLPSIFLKLLKVLFLSTKFFLLLVFLLGCKTIYNYLRSRLKSKKLFLSITITSIVLFLGNIAFLFLENVKYDNFTYSKIGITPETLTIINYFLTLSFFTSLTYLFLETNKAFLTKLKSIDIKFGSIYVHVFILIIFFTSTTIAVFSSMYPLLNYKQIILSARMPADIKFGLQYKYVRALKEVTPDDAVILHPPQGVVWPLIGNQPVIRYFLFPRTLISAGYSDVDSAISNMSVIYLPKITESEAVWPSVVEQGFRVSDNTTLQYKKFEVLESSEKISVYKVYLYE